jgi:glycosyltransferase involved in cell wall biosynthesis
MNIWIFNHYAITPDMPGGTRHYDLGTELTRKGHNVTIFASSINYATRREERLKAGEWYGVEWVNGIQYVWLRTFTYLKNDWRRVVNWVSYFLGVLIFSIKRKERPDVVIGSSVHLFAPLAACIVSRLKRSKFIFEVRDLWPQTLIDMGSMSKNHPLIIFFRFLEGFLYRNADKIITLLPNAGDYIEKFGISEEKIVWIPNGVDVSSFKGNLVSKHYYIPGKFTIMYLGAHGSANALNVILDAGKILQDRGNDKICFLLVGDGPEKKDLIKKAGFLGLRNIEFHSPIPKNCIQNIMGKANAFIFNLEDLPVFKYGISSNKLFGYMNAEKPVIFSCNSYNNPVKEARAGITVPPRNAKALADASEKLYSLPAAKRLNMGKRGRLYVEKNHNIEKLADKLVTVFNEL